jgi:hypothetical protein
MGIFGGFYPTPSPVISSSADDDATLPLPLRLANHAFGDSCDNVVCPDFKQVEEKVNWVLSHFSRGELAMIYRMLYNQGMRIDGCRGEIERLRAALIKAAEELK